MEVGKHWIRYDFPAVYPSEDSEAWVCAFAPSLGDEIAKQFGADTVARMNDIGFKFDAGIDN